MNLSTYTIFYIFFLSRNESDLLFGLNCIHVETLSLGFINDIFSFSKVVDTIIVFFHSRTYLRCTDLFGAEKPIIIGDNIAI